jgi:hypothetical protein
MDQKIRFQDQVSPKLSSADDMQTRLRSTGRLKQESMKEEPAHNKRSQSDPSRSLSNNTNNKPGHLLLWQAQIKLFHTKFYPPADRKHDVVAKRLTEIMMPFSNTLSDLPV